MISLTKGRGVRPKLIMSDKELDEILEEIKKHVLEETGGVDTDKDKDGINKIMQNFSSGRDHDGNENFADEIRSKDDDFIISEEEDISDQTLSNAKPVLEENSLSEEKTEDDKEGKLDFLNFSDLENAGQEEAGGYEEERPKRNKKPLIIAIAVILIIAVAAGIYFGFFYKKANSDDVFPTSNAAAQSNPVTASVSLGPTNPLTGEAGYNEAAIGKRPVAVVVENEYSTESVRPQWGLSDADLVLEGESEYSTRLLLFWADYTNMPSEIGPTRSARPPFIRFSQLFDSIFIHAGLSKTKGSYIGANTVFERDNVDHINLLSYSEDGTYFGRDRTKTSTIEHTGYLNGTNTEALIKSADINTSLNQSKFTEFAFNQSAQKLSETTADSVSFIWSNPCPKTAKFTFDASNSKYTTTDFDSSFGKADLAFENLIFLLDETEYIVKENYKGSGNSETYCNYSLSGGKGTVLSEGTALEITWGTENGKLWMKDADGHSVKLNPGKSYIGYGSSNHGGSISLNTDAQINTEE